MKRLLIVASFSLCQITFAQNYHITYLFKYKEDSTAQNYSDRNFVLQIEPQKTKFILKELIDFNKPIAANTRMFFDIPARQVVSKENNSSEYNNYDVIFQNYYVYKTKDPISWDILKDTKEENGYTLQKATATFGKRQWEAWFIPNIPIPEGPFKFRGLPGLIYEVKDSKSNFIYSLAEIKKLDKPFDTSNVLEHHLGTKPLTISLKKYQELILNDYNNPYAEYRNFKEGSWSIMTDDNRTIETIDGLNQYIKEYQDNIKRKNNPVELQKIINFRKT